MNRGKFLNRYSCEFDFIPNVLTSLYMKGKIDEYIMTHPMEWKKILHKSGFRYDFGIKNIKVEKRETNSKKDKYDFKKWELSDFEIDFKTYEAKVSLKAIYTAHNYLISYDLDGGDNNLFNSNSYNVEMSNITLYEPNNEIRRQNPLADKKL